MKNLIIISKCLRVTKFNPQISICEFHFKGVFAGAVIRKIQLQTPVNFSLKKGEEYLLYVQAQVAQNGILKGITLKSKNLSEIYDQS